MVNTSDNLPDVSGKTDIVKVVLDKLAQAIGWIANHDTPKRIAVKNYIEDIQNSDLSPLEKAILTTRAKKDIREYSNQSRVVEQALKKLSQDDTDVKTDEIDNDWLAEFFDKAKNISDEEFQLIWGRILAGELEQPGSYSKRTLDCLKNLSKDEAAIFMKAANAAVSFRDTVALIFEIDSRNLRSLSSSERLALEEAGLLANSPFILHTNNVPSIEALCEKNGYVLVLEHNSVSSSGINIMVFPFSRSGIELLKTVSIEDKSDNELVTIGKEFKKVQPDIKPTIHKLIPTSDSKLKFEHVVIREI